MKTEDLIQLGALAAIGYLAWQKFSPAASKQPAGTSSTPTTASPLLPDFGSTNPSAGWDDSGANASDGGIGFVQAIVGSIL